MAALWAACFSPLRRADFQYLPGSKRRGVADESALLCEMDARRGDGDLGLTMKKAFAVAHAAQCAGEIDQGAYAGYCAISAMADFILNA